MKLSKLIDDFLVSAEIERNQSPRTIRLYSILLKRFLEFAGDIHMKDVDMPLIRKYRLSLNRWKNKRGQTLSLKSQGYHLIALRAFLRYLVKSDIPCLAPEKIELPKAQERIVTFLTPEEVEELFRAVKIPPREDPHYLQRLRDTAFLEMLYATGLRVSELTSLNRDEVDLKRREFTIRGKGRKPRMVFLTERAAKKIQEYFTARSDNFQPLFLNHHRGASKETISKGEERRLTSYWVEQLVKKYALLAGLKKKVTAHTLRHSFATTLLQRGADIRSVQEMLGHASITTTQIYTHVTNRRLKEIHEKFLPRS